MSINMDYTVHKSSFVDETANIGKKTIIWHFSHVDEAALIGENCILGQNVYIGKNVSIGEGVKIQNNVSVYTGVSIEDYVFIGPSVVFTNDINPRSEFPKYGDYKKTLIQKGATLGANATIICGNTVGSYAIIGAGAVVTKDIPDYSIQIGNPSKHVGWACKCGVKLSQDFLCKNCGRKYEQTSESIKEVSVGI